MGLTPSTATPPPEEFGVLHPQHPFDRCLGTGTKAVPSTEAGKPLKLYFDNQWHTKLYTDRDSSEGYADGFQLKRFSTGRVVLS